MKLIKKHRGKGKTTQLIYISEYTGYPIVVHSKSSVNIVKETASRLECKIPEPITVAELINGRQTIPYENVLIDEAILVCEALLNNLGIRAECATLSYEQ